MLFKQTPSPHIKQNTSVHDMMFMVIYALIPGTLTSIYFFGWGVLFNLAIAISICLVTEAIILKIRHRDVVNTLQDGSALLTACLLALALPALAPWWITAIASISAIAVAKHLYGGLGFNPFNPAMVGYIVVMISFPLEMTLWSAPLSVGGGWPDFSTTFNWVFLGVLPYGETIDSISMATPIDLIKTQLNQLHDIYETRSNEEYSALFSGLSGTGWQWINLCFLAGGIWLIKKDVADWRIPTAFLISLVLISNVFTVIDYSTNSSPLFHAFSGGTMLCAFFIATDPVTASTTPKGRWIYGIGIGALVYIIRNWGGYPDGIAFAVVLMNMAAPLIDYYTQPKVYGDPDR
ncbi:Electron transport complex protein RnfD [hydrothermal vent metagenome]|uniref:Electron transport complex protein RnfD n=1 Tax=hydrothermal vent metagenome TaxID=652676 RepID=A0A3B0W4A3_9ZZZZ